MADSAPMSADYFLKVEKVNRTSKATAIRGGYAH